MLPTLPLYIQDLGGSSRDVGLVMGSFAIGLLIARPQLGVLTDKRGRKLTMIIGMLAVSLPPLGYWWVASIPGSMLIRAIHGVSIAAFAMAYVAMVVDISPDEHRGEVLGYMSLVNPMGTAVGPAFGGFLQEYSGYGPLFATAAAVGLMGFVCLLLVQEPRRSPESVSSTPVGYWGLVASPRVLPLAVMMLFIGLAFGSLVTFAPLAIKQSGVDLNVGLFYTTSAIASFSIRVFSGSASDHFGRGPFITLSLTFFIIAMAVFQSADSVALFLCAGFIEGMGFGILIPMVSTLVADRSAAQERARLFSACMLGFDIGIGLAGPVLGSLAIDGSYRPVFIAASLLALSSLIVFVTSSNTTLPQSLRFAFGIGRDVYAVKDYRRRVESLSH